MIRGKDKNTEENGTDSRVLPTIFFAVITGAGFALGMFFISKILKKG